MWHQHHQTLGAPLRLLIITQFYPPDYAATGQLIEELALQLSQTDFQVQIFTGQPGYAFSTDTAPKYEHSHHLSIQRSQISRLWNQRIRGKAINGLLFCIRAALHLLRVARRHDIALLTTAPPYLPILGYLASHLLGLSYVCVLYDLYPDVAVNLGVIPPTHPLATLWRWINRRVWSRAKQLIVLSPTIRDHIVQQYGIPAHRITVIHSWADPRAIVPCPKQNNWFAQHHGLDRTFTVLYSGNMGRCHDLETILETARLLRHEPVTFLFIGDGAKRSRCMQLAHTYGLTNCRFLPYQDKENLAYSLTACDLSLVTLTHHMEGLLAPSKLYGCLAAGRPVAVICDERSYLKDLVTDAGCGEAFLQGDREGLAAFILHLMAHPDRVEALGRAGRAYLEHHFTPPIIADQYAQVIAQSAGRSRRPQRSSLQAVPSISSND
jgi:glycosyltransferase involved in cell wall biosynthesis